MGKDKNPEEVEPEVTAEMVSAAYLAYYALDSRWTEEDERFEAAIKAALKSQAAARSCHKNQAP